MGFWRMRLRNGFAIKGGEDLWPLCRDNQVAAITYQGITEVNLQPYSRRERPPGWDEVGGGKGSLSHFAWDVRGGDTIFVADALRGEIVGMGFVKPPLSRLGYRFDIESPIVTQLGSRWCHLIDVDWDTTFMTFPYHHPRAPIQTVLELKAGEANDFRNASQIQGHLKTGISNEEAEQALLAENTYSRYSPAELRAIVRRHASLSNAFEKWLNSTHGIRAKQEVNRIDARFEANKRKFLVEFKIAYQGNTRRAIREALGQILEYNHYPPRKSFDSWLLILDVNPSPQDVRYLQLLERAYRLPLLLGWQTNSGFDFSTPLAF